MYNSGLDNGNDAAMKKLLTRHTQSNLLKHRVSKGTDLRICSLMKEKTETLFLFDDGNSLNEYKYFIEVTGLKKDPSYCVPEINTSTTNFALFVKDIAGAAANGKLISRFAEVTRLIYFGTQSSNGNHGIDQSWHNNMHLVVKKLPNLNSLVVNRFGHFGKNSTLEMQNMLEGYCHLKIIHLVQPHDSAIRAAVTSSKLHPTVAYDYKMVNPSEKKDATSFEEHDIKESTVVYLYYLKN